MAKKRKAKKVVTSKRKTKAVAAKRKKKVTPNVQREAVIDPFPNGWNLPKG